MGWSRWGWADDAGVHTPRWGSMGRGVAGPSGDPQRSCQRPAPGSLLALPHTSHLPFPAAFGARQWDSVRLSRPHPPQRVCVALFWGHQLGTCLSEVRLDNAGVLSVCCC